MVLRPGKLKKTVSEEKKNPISMHSSFSLLQNDKSIFISFSEPAAKNEITFLVNTLERAI